MFFRNRLELMAVPARRWGARSILALAVAGCAVAARGQAPATAPAEPVRPGYPIELVLRSPSSAPSSAPLAGATVLWTDAGAGPGRPPTLHRLELTGAGFRPATMVVAVGDTIELVNGTDSAHELFASSPASPLPSDLVSRNAKVKVVPKQAGELAVYCDDHPDEAAYVLVGNGTSQISDDQGVVRMRTATPGAVTALVLHPSFVAEPVVIPERSASAVATLRRDVQLTARPGQHRNKAGRNYPPAPASIELIMLRQGRGDVSEPAAGAVAWVVGSSPPRIPGRRLAASAADDMSAKDKRFQPRVVAVHRGAAVDFPNLDKIYHNVFSRSETRTFDLGLYRDGKSKSVEFDAAGVVKVYCNIHPQMVGYVVVVDGHNFAVADDAGRVRLEGLAPGAATLKIWDERAGESTRQIDTKPGQLMSLSLELDAVAYKDVPHFNKYGEAYTEPEDDDSRY